MDFHGGHKRQLRAADTRSHTRIEIRDPSLYPSSRRSLTLGAHNMLQRLQLHFPQTLALKPSLICLSIGVSRDSCLYEPDILVPPHWCCAYLHQLSRIWQSQAGLQPPPPGPGPSPRTETPENEELVKLLGASLSDPTGRLSGAAAW